jgi:hypothetical protein
MIINGVEVSAKSIIIGAALALSFAGGMGLGKKIWQKQTVIRTEPAAPEVKQKDGSTILERKKTDPNAKAKTDLPPGSKLQRTVTLVVRPQDPSSGGVALNLPHLADGLVVPGGVNLSLGNQTQSKDVKIDLSIVTMPDGTTRVIGATAPGYTIVGGVDQPVAPLEQPVAYLNSLHISYRVAGDGYGVVYTRDFLNRFVAGVNVQLIKDKSLRGMNSEAWLSLGYRW